MIKSVAKFFGFIAILLLANFLLFESLFHTHSPVGILLSAGMFILTYIVGRKIFP